MAVRAKVGISGKLDHVSKPKKTNQGSSSNSRLSATSRNGRRKAYRGQGK